ncbi:unnamed protein product [Arabis nemorensis]|uniref:RING-type E3 ubiquitin transferase n=1 Tax=Arabis nemorensis TaxID=586526 RepID=A0A565C254_9BRAS|nr:unnamed protein product [Arabis nemorensis]
MNTLQVIYHVKGRNLSPSEGLTNSVLIIVDTRSVEIIENPTTRQRTLTGRSTPTTRSFPIIFCFRSVSHDHIHSLLHNQLSTSHRWLCVDLASEISTAATMLGFGRNGIHLTIVVKITYETVVVMSNDEGLSKRAALLRMVLLGKIGREELKSLKMETEPCSICLENLSGSKPGSCATRMTCSHVFHDLCLLEWLKRKNTCPLCRTVLYDP